MTIGRLRSRYTGAGYAFIDERASDWGYLVESDVLACGKCERVIFRHNYVDQHGIGHLGWDAQGAQVCNCCDSPICVQCANGPPCELATCGGAKARFERQINEFYHRGQRAKILGV
jgi:hypothetical protein